MKTKLVLHLFIVLGLVLSGSFLAGSAQARPYHQTTLTVTTLADSGAGSLREAITSANANPGADDIVFEVDGPILLQSPLPLITADLSIDGAGHGIWIDGADLYTIFESGVAVNWRLANLGLTQSLGSAVTNRSFLDIENCEFQDNIAGQGGALFNTTFVTISDSSFSRNQADQGGAIYSTGFLTVEGAQFIENDSGGEGGAVYSNLIATLNDVAFERNQAGFAGGAIFVDASISSRMEIHRSSFLDNNAGDDEGGAISNHGVLFVYDTDFQNNAVNNAGGAIYNNRSMQVFRSTFTGNSSKWGGAIYQSPRGASEVRFSAFENNIAGHWGGAISNEGGYMRIETSLFTRNAGTDLGGGAILSTEALNVHNSTFSENYHPQDGAAIYNLGYLAVWYNTFADNHIGDPTGAALSNHGSMDVSSSLIARTYGGSNCAGTFFMYSPNQSDDGSCSGFSQVNPLLGPLADNGGPTRTHALLFDSPAIDADVDRFCPATDQRGVARPFGPACDLGAYEYDLDENAIPIDVKPKSSTNPIDLVRGGTVSVAVLSQPGFDALTQVDRNSLTFGASGWEDSLVVQSNGRLLCGASDVNGDGLADLVCLFDISASGLTCGYTRAYLRGVRFGTEVFVGSDVIGVPACH